VNYIIHPNVELGKNAIIGDFCIIGVPARGKQPGECKTVIGDNAVIRSHSVIYAGNIIGRNFSTGHHTVIREENRIGDDVSIGTQSCIEHHISIGNGVRIHSQVFVPEFSQLQDFCWLGPNVVLTNAKYPRSRDVKASLTGPIIEKNAKIGANTTILPGCRIGSHALIGSGSVVVKDIPAGKVAYGNPAVIRRNIRDIGLYENEDIERMKVPFMNLFDSIRPIYPKIVEKIKWIIENATFIGGKEVLSFEEEFAEYASIPYTVGCATGTDALVIALKALGIGPGDKVITVPNSFIATAEAISAVGADILFVDVYETYFTMSPTLLKSFLEKNYRPEIKAIIPVHLYGQMAQMDALRETADEYGLRIIEDSAQAHGALYNGKSPGSYGDIAIYSFYPGKNLGAFGDAGALVTKDRDVFTTMKMMVNHGRGDGKYEHLIKGFNSRLDTIQAAILRIKLKQLKALTEMRIQKAALYDEILKTKDIILPCVRDNARHVYHLYVIRHEHREEIQRILGDNGISCGVHYPVPLHLQPAYKDLAYKKGDFPVTERLSETILSLPLWPEITREQIEYVASFL
jgi:dTDP-4-amino-4,6-dideoxygalactose transaminase/acetyltransferase-like isoleucine patch superfamily enzyme